MSTLGTQDTGRRQKKTTKKNLQNKTRQKAKKMSNIDSDKNCKENLSFLKGLAGGL